MQKILLNLNKQHKVFIALAIFGLSFSALGQVRMNAGLTREDLMVMRKALEAEEVARKGTIAAIVGADLAERVYQAGKPVVSRVTGVDLPKLSSELAKIVLRVTKDPKLAEIAKKIGYVIRAEDGTTTFLFKGFRFILKPIIAGAVVYEVWQSGARGVDEIVLAGTTSGASFFDLAIISDLLSPVVKESTQRKILEYTPLSGPFLNYWYHGGGKIALQPRVQAAHDQLSKVVAGARAYAYCYESVFGGNPTARLNYNEVQCVLVDGSRVSLSDLLEEDAFDKDDELILDEGGQLITRYQYERMLWDEKVIEQALKFEKESREGFQPGELGKEVLKLKRIYERSYEVDQSYKKLATRREFLDKLEKGTAIEELSKEYGSNRFGFGGKLTNSEMDDLIRLSAQRRRDDYERAWEKKYGQPYPKNNTLSF